MPGILPNSHSNDVSIILNVLGNVCFFSITAQTLRLHNRLYLVTILKKTV